MFFVCIMNGDVDVLVEFWFFAGKGLVYGNLVSI